MSPLSANDSRCGVRAFRPCARCLAVVLRPTALHASEEGRRRLAAPPGEVAGARACRFSGEVDAAGAGSFSREVEVAIPPAPFLSGGVQEHFFCD